MTRCSCTSCIRHVISLSDLPCKPSQGHRQLKVLSACVRGSSYFTGGAPCRVIRCVGHSVQFLELAPVTCTGIHFPLPQFCFFTVLKTSIFQYFCHRLPVYCRKVVFSMEYAPGSSDKENPTLIMPAFSNQYKYCLLDSSSALSPQHLTPQSTTLQVRGPTEQILQTSSNPSTPIPVSFTVSHEQQERSATTKAMPPVEKPLQSDGLHWEASMAGRTHWTKAMLQRLLDLGQQQTPPRETLSILQVEFGNQKAPKHLGEVVAEYNLARRGVYLPTETC